jgi:hypothetical protein
MKNIYAVKLGRKGGLKKSPQKSASSQRNGARGGRPPKYGILNWEPFMNALDESRRNTDLNPFKKLIEKSKVDRERALLLATAKVLSNELNIELPDWARETICLRQPFFVSEIENLKASAILESPPEYKVCNIFVLNNFLNRA